MAQLITKKFTTLLLGFIAMLACMQFLSAQDTIPAFPGAEGFGKYVSGGRGGRIVEVTNLEDKNRYGVYPEGSLRYALKTSGDDPITIVFRVSGTIELSEDLESDRSNVTIAGQTAPGDGICIKDFTVRLSGENLIIRYIRFRPGDESSSTSPSCLNIENSRQIIVDHCSMSWSVEENFGFYDNDSTTVQWCILSESLYQSKHPKGDRGYACQWGGEWASYHHNLLAHHNSRTPRFNGAHSNDFFAVQDFRNNVIYNQGGSGSIYGGETEVTKDTNSDGINDAKSRINFVNNYIKLGNAYSGSIFIAPSYHREDYEATGYSEWYFDGNVLAGNSDVTANNWLGVNASEITGGKDSIKVDTPHDVEAITTNTAEEAYELVLTNAGAILPIRDTVDKRVVASVRNKTGGIIDSQSEVGGWPTLYTPDTNQIPDDTDRDGMPDYWETENGLNPNDSLDGPVITSDGYSNLEHYLNSDIPYIKPKALGLSNITAMDELELFPNPANDKIYFSNTLNITQVSIYSISGSLVIVKDNMNTNSIDISSIDPGIYFIKAISGDNNIYSQKIIKK